MQQHHYNDNHNYDQLEQQQQQQQQQQYDNYNYNYNNKVSNNSHEKLEYKDIDLSSTNHPPPRPPSSANKKWNTFLDYLCCCVPKTKAWRLSCCGIVLVILIVIGVLAGLFWPRLALALCLFFCLVSSSIENQNSCC